MAKKGKKKSDKNSGKFGEKVVKKKKLNHARVDNFYAIPLERRIQLVPQLTNHQLPVLPHSFIPNLIGSAINRQFSNPFNGQMFGGKMNVPFLQRFSMPPIIPPPVPKSLMVPRMDFPPLYSSSNNMLLGHPLNGHLSSESASSINPSSIAQSAGTKFWWDKDLDIDQWNSNRWNKDSSRRWDTWSSQDDKNWPLEEKWPHSSTVHSYGSSANSNKLVQPFDDLLQSDDFPPAFIKR